MSRDYGVFIPARDAERTLGAAIDSVLAQTLPPARVIVIDDGSTDATAAIARGCGPPVELVRQPHLGPGRATDRGLGALSAPWIAGLDADDLWTPEKAERQIADLEREPTVAGVFCRARIFAHGTDPGPGSPVQDLWGRSAMMLRREALAQLGPVAAGDARELGEMIRWLAHGRRAGLRFAMRPEVLVARRIIPGSLSHGRTAASLLPLVRGELERRGSA